MIFVKKCRNGEENRGFEPERSCKKAKAQALTDKSGAGRAGERVGGMEVANKMFATGRRIPLSPKLFQLLKRCYLSRNVSMER